MLPQHIVNYLLFEDLACLLYWFMAVMEKYFMDFTVNIDIVATDPLIGRQCVA